MPTKVLVPRLGEGVEEVTITKWLKQEGDSVKELEPLLEVNTDKVDTEIPSPATGVLLKILFPENSPAKVGEVLAVIGQPGENADAPEAASTVPSAAVTDSKPASASTATVAANVPSGKGDLGFISPVVAKVASERGIDLQQVRGTGLNGRITKNDVLAFIEKGGSGVGGLHTPVPFSNTETG